MPHHAELVPTPDVIIGACLKRYTSAALEGTLALIIKATPGKIYAAHVENTSAGAYWLMLFDKATIPVNGDTPIWRHKVLTVASADIVVPPFGIRCANGIGAAISSTSGTLTLDVASDTLLSILFA